MTDDVLEIDTDDPAEWPADPAEWPRDLVVRDIDDGGEAVYTQVLTEEGWTMSSTHGLTGISSVRRRCTAMQPTASRRQGLITESDGTHTSKCPYMGVCNQRRCRAIRGDIGAMASICGAPSQGALSCTLEVVRR